MKIILTLVLLFVLAQAKELSIDDMKKEPRVAFIIENVDYEGVASEANIGTINGIEKYLQDNGFEVVYLKNANRSDIIRSFRSFNVKLQEGGIALFYFRGHAVQVDKINYLLPIDILQSGSSSLSKSLSVNTVLETMNKANSRMNMIVIDSVGNAKISKLLSVDKKGLAKLSVQKNTDLVISSKVDSAEASEDLTQQLLEIFKEKGLSTRDGFSKFEKENKKAYVEVSDQDFYFKLPSKLVSAEDKLWEKSLGLGSLASLSLYIKTYPKGKYKSTAESSIEKLELEKAKKAAEAKAEAKKKAAIEAEIKKQVELELAKIAEAKEKEKLLKHQQDKKLDQKKLAAVVPEVKAKEYKKAFYIEPEMVNIAASAEQKAFSIGKYEVSNKEYKAFLQATQSNQSLSRYDQMSEEPVVNVSFQEAKEYATWLSAMTGKKYSLPTQSQWEYSARSGTDTTYFWGNSDVSMKKAFWLKDKPNNAHIYAWIKTNSSELVHNIGEKEQNPWGLYDIYGNVSEWCINTDINEAKQALRGGSFLSDSEEIQSGAKIYKEETYKSQDLGFRLVKEI